MSDFEVRLTDTLFQDSPDIGDPACLCSRCLKVIGDDVGVPIRAFVDEGHGGEYRFHPACFGFQTLAGADHDYSGGEETL